MFEALIKDVSASEAKERLGLALFKAVIHTVLCVGFIGVDVLNIVLHKSLPNKIIYAFGLLLPVALIPVIWRFYFCFRERAAEGE